jgi:hypothetical protein
MWPYALDIEGFCTENRRQEHGSEDAGYLDARIWSEAAQEEAKLLQLKLEIVKRPNMLPWQASEYPNP